MRLFRNLGFKLLAVVVAFMLWGVSHSTTSRERGFDLPVTVEGVPEDLVVTEQSTDTVNVRVRGSRAALRRMLEEDLIYPADLSGAKVGVTRHEVETGDLELPRGLQIVSRSPARIDFTLARRARKAVPLKPDLTGEPAPGFRLEGVEIDPRRVWVTGERSEVLRLSEVLTETVDMTGQTASFEKRVRPLLVGRNLWLENTGEVKVRVSIVPESPPEADEEKG